MAREGRGWLSSLDLVPDHARAEIEWAKKQLDARERTQADILFELNDRLEALGVDPISKSAFNRASVRQDIARRAIADLKYIMSDSVSPSGEEIDKGNVLLSEMVKNLMLASILARDGDVNTKETLELAKAFHHLTAGQKLSGEQRAQRDKAFVTQTEEAIDKAVKATGLSAEQAARLRRDILGVRPQAETSGG